MNKNISPATIVRTVVLLFTLVNQMLIMSGKNPLPFAEDEIYTVVSGVVTVVVTLWTWWKNNSFTGAAVKADAYLKELKGAAGKQEGE